MPKLKTYKRLYNAKRNILVDMDPDSTAANAPLPSSIDTTSSKSSDGFRSFFPTKKKFAGGYGIPKNKKKSRKETEVVNDTPVNEMQEEVESSDGSTVVSHSKRMRSRIRIDSSESEQSGVGKDAYPTRQREVLRFFSSMIYKHITDYNTYALRCNTTDTMPLGANTISTLWPF